MTTFVADNLLNYLKDDSKDLFIKYYHLECEHCIDMEADWQELAEAVSDIPDLLIGEYNTQLNEIPGMDIESVPSIRLYK